EPGILVAGPGGPRVVVLAAQPVVPDPGRVRHGGVDLGRVRSLVRTVRAVDHGGSPRDCIAGCYATVGPPACQLRATRKLQPPRVSAHDLSAPPGVPTRVRQRA